MRAIRFVSVILLLLCPSLVMGQHPSVVRIHTRHKICTQNPYTGQKSCRIEDGWGSGVAVGVWERRTVIATAAHVIRECVNDAQNNGVFIFYNGSEVQAFAAAFDEVADVGLITVPTGVPVVELDEDVPVGAEVVALGYPAKEWQEVRQRVRSRDPQTVWGDRSLGQGHSGGGLFHQNRLAGVLSATVVNGQGSASVPIDRLRRLLDWNKTRYRCRCRGVVRLFNDPNQSRSPVVPAPTPPRIVQPPAAPVDVPPPPEEPAKPQPELPPEPKVNLGPPTPLPPVAPVTPPQVVEMPAAPVAPTVPAIPKSDTPIAAMPAANKQESESSKSSESIEKVKKVAGIGMDLATLAIGIGTGGLGGLGIWGLKTLLTRKVGGAVASGVVGAVGNVIHPQVQPPQVQPVQYQPPVAQPVQQPSPERQQFAPVANPPRPHRQALPPHQVDWVEVPVDFRKEHVDYALKETVRVYPGLLATMSAFQSLINQSLQGQGHGPETLHDVVP